jgi:hypothetical protein
MEGHLAFCSGFYETQEFTFMAHDFHNFWFFDLDGSSMYRPRLPETIGDLMVR